MLLKFLLYRRVFHEMALRIFFLMLFLCIVFQGKADSSKDIPVILKSRRLTTLFSGKSDLFAVIKGIVSDTQGNPLSGVSVLIEGSTKGTSTDENGKFTINAAIGDKLEFTIVGFSKKTIVITSENDLKIQLSIEAVAGNEIVIVGYGSQKKVNLTGAITTVDMSDILGDRPVTSAAQALQGAAPGLQITTGSGQPGSSSSLNIRGFTSINGG